MTWRAATYHMQLCVHIFTNLTWVYQADMKKNHELTASGAFVLHRIYSQLPPTSTMLLCRFFAALHLI